MRMKLKTRKSEECTDYVVPNYLIIVILEISVSD